MQKLLLVIAVSLLSTGFIAMVAEQEQPVVTKIYKYQLTDDSHVFDGISPYWVEVSPGNECDPIDPSLPCTVTIDIGTGSGQFSSLDAFLDQFSTVNELMQEQNVTGKDE